MAPRARPVEERFLSKVTKTETCWLWTAGRDSSGYSSLKADGRRIGGHRWSYEHFVGRIPEGMELDHLCRIRHCVNPDHLEPVTQAENARRARLITTSKMDCPNGHPYTPENTYIYKGARNCRACNRRRVAEYKARRTDLVPAGGA